MSDIDFTKMSQKLVARALGVNPITISRWEVSGAPRNADKSYSLPALVDFLVDRGNGSQAVEQNSPALERFREARAKMVELELAERQGGMISRKQVVEELSDLVFFVKGQFLSLPSRLAPILANLLNPREVFAELNGEIKRVLSQISKGCEHIEKRKYVKKCR